MSNRTAFERLARKLSYNQISLISIALYVPALLLPTPFDQQGVHGDETYHGWLLLMIGWLGITTSLGSWLANPLIIYSWISNWAGRHRHAFQYGLLATLFAALFLLVDEIPLNEGGETGPITGYNAGYWLWLASCAVFTLLHGLKLTASGLSLRDALIGPPRPKE